MGLRTHTIRHTHLLCLLPSESQEVVSRPRLQHGTLTKSNAARPHRVHHLTTTFPQIPLADLHVSSMTAPPKKTEKNGMFDTPACLVRGCENLYESADQNMSYPDLMRASLDCSVLSQITELPEWPSMTFSALLLFRLQMWMTPFPDLQNPRRCLLIAV